MRSTGRPWCAGAARFVPILQIDAVPVHTVPPYRFPHPRRCPFLRQYIVLSDAPWRSVPSRTQQLSARFRGEVLYFEPPGASKRSHRDPGRQVRPNVILYTLPSAGLLPVGGGLARPGGWRRQGAFISRAALRHGFREPLLWTTCPAQVHLLDHLTYRGLVYDCAADWSRLSPRWEGDLAAAADVVFAASPALADHLSPCSGNIALLPNGVNFPMFCRSDLDPPRELRGIRGPVLGWIGSIDERLDLSPLLRTAREHPRWTFLLVGKVLRNPLLAALQALPNVHFAGRRPMVEIPEYVGCFDVCLDLRRKGQDIYEIVPRRVFEYLSTGKPIVTPLYPGQVEAFPDVIYGAHGPEEYSLLCERALEEDPAWVSQRRKDYGAAAAWSRRVEEVQQILGDIGLA